MHGWTLEEYQNACNNDAFFESVKGNLQQTLSPSTTDVVSVSSSSSLSAANPDSVSEEEKMK